MEQGSQDIGVHEFYSKYVSKSMPVVLKKYSNSWAMKTSLEVGMSRKEND